MENEFDDASVSTGQTVPNFYNPDEYPLGILMLFKTTIKID